MLSIFLHRCSTVFFYTRLYPQTYFKRYCMFVLSRKKFQALLCDNFRFCFCGSQNDLHQRWVFYRRTNDSNSKNFCLVYLEVPNVFAGLPGGRYAWSDSTGKVNHKAPCDDLLPPGGCPTPPNQCDRTLDKFTSVIIETEIRRSRCALMDGEDLSRYILKNQNTFNKGCWQFVWSLQFYAPFLNF